MKYQHIAFKLQEAEAAWELFEKSRRQLAQVEATLALGDDGPQGDELDQVRGIYETLERRTGAYEKLFLERTGASDLEDGMYRMQEIRARLNQIQERRSEHVALKAELEAELTLGSVTPEDRAKAEGMLEAQKRRMEVLCQQAEKSLPADRLILL